MGVKEQMKNGQSPSDSEEPLPLALRAREGSGIENGGVEEGHLLTPALGDLGTRQLLPKRLNWQRGRGSREEAPTSLSFYPSFSCPHLSRADSWLQGS